MRVQHHIIRTSIFHWFPVSPTYSWHCLLKSRSIEYSGYLLRTYSCGIRILSATGSDSHKLIALPYAEQSPLVTESHSTLILSLCLASRVFLSSPFSSPYCIDFHCSAFLPCLLSKNLHEPTGMWKYCIAHK